MGDRFFRGILIFLCDSPPFEAIMIVEPRSAIRHEKVPTRTLLGLLREALPRPLVPSKPADTAENAVPAHQTGSEAALLLK
jgi:hypothetical protein